MARFVLSPHPTAADIRRQSLLPFSSNGYAVRTHEVASALVQSGVEVIAVLCPGSPWDRAGFADAGFALEHRIDGVRYVHLPATAGGQVLHAYTVQVAQAFAELARVFRRRR